MTSKYETSPIPAGTTSLIFRLSNDHPGTHLNSINRVKNEVAFMTLVQKALSETKYSRIVPNIYAWVCVASGQGFTIHAWNYARQSV